jgi:amino acid transporter
MANGKKYSGLIQSGAFAALYVALGAQFFSSFFKQVNNVYTLVAFTLAFAIILFILFIGFIEVKVIVVEIIESESNKLIELANLLEDILLEYTKNASTASTPLLD